MTTIDPSLESELIRRFPFSPKVRPIAAERILQDEVSAHHARGNSYSDTERSHFRYYTPEKVKINHAAEVKTASTNEKSSGSEEKNSTPSELAKLNAKLEDMLFRNSIPTYDNTERKSLYESAIIKNEDNIIVRADNQIQKSQALYPASLTQSMTLMLEKELQMRIDSKKANLNAYNYSFSPKKSEYEDDLLRVEDLKTSQVIEDNLMHLWATTDPEILRIIDEIRGRKPENKIVTNEEKIENEQQEKEEQQEKSEKQEIPQKNDAVKTLEF